MISISIEFSTDNAAFEGEGRRFELAQILAEIGRKCANDEDEGKLRDSNGNTVGKWFLIDTNPPSTDPQAPACPECGSDETESTFSDADWRCGMCEHTWEQFT